jgi:hypothetical protein
MPRWLGMSHMLVLGVCWVQAYCEEILILEDKTQFWRKTVGRKSNTCEVNPHAKKESMQGAKAVRPNHVRVSFLECNG